MCPCKGTQIVLIEFINNNDLADTFLLPGIKFSVIDKCKVLQPWFHCLTKTNVQKPKKSSSVWAGQAGYKSTTTKIFQAKKNKLKLGFFFFFYYQCKILFSKPWKMRNIITSFSNML